MLSPAEFEPEFIAKSDKYLKEDLVPPTVGGFEAFCATAKLADYANSRSLTDPEMVELVKHVFNKRWEVLTSDAKMGVQSTMEGLFAILCQAVVDYSTEKQAKLAAAMNPAGHEVRTMQTRLQTSWMAGFMAAASFACFSVE